MTDGTLPVSASPKHPTSGGARVNFDITTAAHWSGRAVGIVRVERELARRGPAIVGADFGYCVYDRAENLFHRLAPADAAEILAGELQIDFSPPPPPVVPPPPPPPTPAQRLKRVVRRTVMSSRTLYAFTQRLRGRNFTEEQLDRIFAGSLEVPEGYVPPIPDWVPPERVRKKGEPRRALLSEVSQGHVALTPGTTIISGGLDWEYKDIRAIYRLKKEQPFTYVAVLYDLIPLLLPHFVVPAYVDLLTSYFGELFWTADKCLAISAATERDGRAYVAENQLLNPPLLANFPLGSDLPDERGEDEADLELPPSLKDAQFVLYVSTIEPRKNHRLVYHAWQVGIRQGRIDPKKQKLVFVGHAGWNVNDLLYEIETNPILEGSIVRLHGVSDGLLAYLYKKAAFCVLPSRYEGYGLPLAESLRHAKPCLTTTAGSLREVGGDLATYLDPDDVFAWTDMMVRWLDDPRELEAQSARIKASYIPIEWKKSAEIFFDLALKGTAS